MEYLLGRLFGNGQSSTDQERVEIMNREIARVGGLLHFTVKSTARGTEDNGWSAQCDEIPGIITGGENPDPSNEQVEQGIREAIHTAFNISIGYKSYIVRNIDSPAPLFKLNTA